MLTILTGAVAGAFHVLSGPDHLAAVAPLAALNPRRSWVAGWTWGVGHASGVVVVAVAAVLFRETLPPVQTISGWSERMVGAVLIALGIWGLRSSARIRTSAHTHSGLVHDHLHVQGGPRWVRTLGHAHASFCLGVLHGIAGSSHFFGVLPALALPMADAFIYIAAFGVGTVVAMSVFASTIGRLSRAPWARHAVPMTAAILAIVVGAVWLLP